MYDMKHMGRLRHMKELAPKTWQAFTAFNDAALAEGEIPARTKTLIAVAVAHATQCAYCIEVHVRRARKEGVTDQELAEATLVTAALRAGGAIAHATHVLPE